MRVFRPPEPVVVPDGAPSVFLAGSIEMGSAPDWQSQLVRELRGELDGVVVLDPRRDAWDASWVQSIANAEFRAQVEWELENLERADVIAMWFVSDTKSPITLLELGLHARGGRLIVGCPDGFWRRGNIEVVCARYAIPLVGTWAAFVAAVGARLAAVMAATDQQSSGTGTSGAPGTR